MPSRKADLFSTIHAEGGLFTPDFLQLVLDQSKEIEHTTPDSYNHGGHKLSEIINHQWNLVNQSWQRFTSGAHEQGYLFEALDEGEGVLPTRDNEGDAGPLEGLTRQRWLLPLFRALEYGSLGFQRQLVLGDRTYPLSHLAKRVPIHLVAASAHLDRRPSRSASQSTDGIVRTSPHAMLQELLNRSDDYLWGFVGNGLRLRLLRDSVSLTRQSFVEFDLHAMMKGQVYPDFKLLWLLCHESRLNAERAEQSILEQWRNTALQHGARALEKLRDGVEKAINTLGGGFLKATTSDGNQRLRQRLKSGELTQQEYYRQVLRLVYRLLFLFVVEDRQLLFRREVDADKRRIYQDYYSTRHLRDLAARPRGSQHPDLWRGLQLVFRSLGQEEGCPQLGLPGLGSFLFSDQAMPDLEQAGSVAKIVKLEHAWRRLDGRNDDGFQVAPFPG